MTAIEVLHAVEKAGGSVALNRGQIKYAIPKPAAWLVPELRRQRDEVVALLTQRTVPPAMPEGVRLVKWAPKEPPVILQQWSVVIELDKFISSTLAQLRARLEGKDFLAGNWTQRELIERLEQVGLEVEVDSTMANYSSLEEHSRDQNEATDEQ